HEAVEIEFLPLPQTFIRKEKEKFVPQDGPAELAAELVTFKWWWFARIEGEEVTRVEDIVAQEFKRFTVKSVRTGSRRDCDQGAGTLSVSGAESRIVDFEFLHCSDRWLESDRTVRQVVQRHAVNDIVNRLFAVAGRGERKRTQTANRGR